MQGSWLDEHSGSGKCAGIARLTCSSMAGALGHITRSCDDSARNCWNFVSNSRMLDGPAGGFCSWGAEHIASMGTGAGVLA